MTDAAAIHTLVLTDIVDSTALTEQLGDARMAVVWARHDRLVRDLAQRWGGTEVDRTDGFLLIFERVDAAVRFCEALHSAFDQLSQELGLPFRARIGVHRGAVILLETPADARARGAKALELEGLNKPLAARIMSLAGPGQTLLSGEARAALEESTLQVVCLGHWRLKGVAEPVEIFEVASPGGGPPPPLDQPKAYRVHWRDDGWTAAREARRALPAERGGFQGRERELRGLRERLDAGERLLTVLGVGGMGKTRLALRFAWSHLGEFPGGAWFCDLSEAREARGIHAAVARALDVPLGGDDPVAQLGHAIAARGFCLILLDNTEQVTSPMARALSTWLDRAPEARFLVTSRERLGLPGEVSIALQPLELADAIALFLRRAREANASFEARDGDAEDVTALVSLLDRLPLAIELAAARTVIWSPGQILARMGERFRVLSSRGGRIDRQATLRATLDWSWELLSDEERSALSQISVFQGGFAVEAAEQVVQLDDAWIADALQSLVDRSLLSAVGHERLELLACVQDYASLRLDERGDRAAVELRHGRCFAAWGAPDRLAGLDASGGAARRRALTLEFANLQAACRRAVVRPDPSVAAATALAIWATLELRGPLEDGISLLEEVLRMPGHGPSERARLALELGRACRIVGAIDLAEPPLKRAMDAGLAGVRALAEENLGIVARQRGQLDAAQAHFAAALDHHRAVGDRAAEAGTLVHIGVLLRERGELQESRRYLLDARALHREVGNRRGEALASGNLGNLLVELGLPDEARQAFDATLAAHRELGNRRGEGITLGNLANLLRSMGQDAEALERFRAARDISAEVGDRHAVGNALSNIGTVQREAGAMAEARETYDEALAIAREVGHRRLEALVLTNLGILQQRVGERVAAAASLSAALVLHREQHNRSLEAVAAAHLAQLQLDGA